MSLSLPREAAPGPGSLPWTLDSALGAGTGGRSGSPGAQAPSSVGRSWGTPGKTPVMSYAAALFLLPSSAPCEVGGQLDTTSEGPRAQQDRGPRLDCPGDFPSLWWRLTFFRGLQGQRRGSGCRTPGLEREEAGPEGEAGMGARAGPEAEIQGSSETGEVMQGPARPSGSKPGREGKAVWEGGSQRPPTPPPMGGTGSKPQVVGAGGPNLWIYGQKYSEARLAPSSRKAGIAASVPKGCPG